MLPCLRVTYWSFLEPFGRFNTSFTLFWTAILPLSALQRGIWLRGHLWKSCENAVLSTWDEEVWEKCNKFVGEEGIKRCTVYMGEGNISSSQSWAGIKNISSNCFKSRCCFCLLNFLISWTGAKWMVKSRHVWILWNITCECRSQAKIKMLSDVLHFDFIFAGLHTNTVSLTQ